MIGTAKIIPSVDRTYRPDPSGRWAVVLGVHDHYVELADLVAWEPYTSSGDDR